MKKTICLALVLCSALLSLVSCGGSGGGYYYRATKVTYSGEKDNASITITLNENGLPVKEVKEKNAEIYSVVENSYDNRGNLIKTVTTTKGDTDSVDTLTFTYDRFDRLIRTEGTVEDMDESIYEENEYDENGRLIKVTRNYGGETSIDLFTYNEKGELARTVYESEYSVTTIDYTYDEKGNLLKESTMYEDSSDPSQNHSNESNYTYDEKGNLLTIGAGEDLINHSYDDEGRLIRIVYPYVEIAYFSYKGHPTYDISYDENGNVAEIKLDNFDGKRTYKFEYERVYVPYDKEIDMEKEVGNLYFEMNNLYYKSLRPIILNPDLVIPEINSDSVIQIKPLPEE